MLATTTKDVSFEQSAGRAKRDGKVYVGSPSSNPVDAAGVSLLRERVVLSEQVESLSNAVSELSERLEITKAVSVELREQRDKYHENLDSLQQDYDKLVAENERLEEQRDQFEASFASEAAVNEKIRLALDELAMDSTGRCVCEQLRAFEDTFRPIDVPWFSDSPVQPTLPVQPDVFLTQPLLTDEGFVNEACMNELEMALSKMPRLYVRCQDDEEFTRKRITNWREVTGYFAMWACRQIAQCDTSAYPPKLESVVGYLAASLRKHWSDDPCVTDDWCELSLNGISELLYDILWGLKLFHTWNDEKVLLGWIDLDALITNVVISIRDERRKHDAFDKKFNEENGTSI